MEQVMKKPAPRDITVVNPEQVYFRCEWRGSTAARGVMNVTASVFGWQVEIETTAKASGCGYNKEIAVFEDCASKAREKAAKLFGSLLALPVCSVISPDRQISAIFGTCKRWERLDDNSYNYQSGGRFRPCFSGVGKRATWDGAELVRTWNCQLDHAVDTVRASKMYKATKSGGTLVDLLGYSGAVPRFVKFARPLAVTVETETGRGGYRRYHAEIETDDGQHIIGDGATPREAISDAARPSIFEKSFLALPLVPDGLTVDWWGAAIFENREDSEEGVVRFSCPRERIDFEGLPAMREGMEAQLKRCANISVSY